MHSATAIYRRRNSTSPAIASRKLNFSVEYDEQDGVSEGEKMQTFAVDDDGDEDSDDEDLDRFEDDGFIVDVVVEEEANEEQKRRKKRKKRSLKNIVLDEDDLQLIQENATLGIVSFKDKSQGFKRLKQAEKSSEIVEFTGFYDDSILDDVYGEEEARSDNEEDDMGTYIVDDEIGVKRLPLRYWNPGENVSKQALAVYSSPSKKALKEAGYLIGDVNELLKERKQALALAVESDHSNEFEPLYLLDKYISERDDNVREVDLPERMQMFEEIAGPPLVDIMSMEEESDWILCQLAKNVFPLLCTKRTQEEVNEGFGPLDKIKKADIMRFLELHHAKKYDIPFISMYRKEQCQSLLENIEEDEEQDKANDSLEQSCRLKWHKILWTVKELDKKWLLLHIRKTAMQAYYEKRYDKGCERIGDDVELSLYKQQPFESITESLKMAELEAEIDDVEMKFNLHFPLDEDMVDGNFKRPNRKSLYAKCRNAGLWKLASHFGYNSEQLGLRITLKKVGMELPVDPDEAPEEIASKFTCPMFDNPEAVLKGARHMAAVEISCEPCIRKYVRSVFMDKAVVSTNSTPKGNKVVDSLHQFAAVKWLRDKPLTKFKDAQWLLIQKAEEEKLLQVTIRLLEKDLNSLLVLFNGFYLLDGVGTFNELWNEQRKLVLSDSISNFLLPAMEKEARVALTVRAKKWLLLEYGKQLWKKVSVAPCVLKEDIPPRVMACCWGPGNPATTFVMLDSSGELLEVLEAGSLHQRSQNVNTQQRKQNDQLRVFKFIGNHQPNVIVIGAANVSCVELKDKIKEIVSKIEDSRDTVQDVDKIIVVYGDESLPQLYAHRFHQFSCLDNQEKNILYFGWILYAGIIKRAVALGRYIQSPLAMVANLCGTEKEIISWKISSLDHYLLPDEKYEMIEQVMVDVTNQVGLDINMALKQTWYLPLLQFVSGLGPQKAAVLRQKMVEGRAISSRKGLASFGLSTKVVFHNAVGFLCVRHSGFLNQFTAIELLDGTRIHPESYSLAEKLAKAICNDAMVEDPIEYLKKNPGLLNEFNIDDFADNHEIEEGENIKETLFHIKMELLHGFLDPREPYNEPTADEEFKMITGKYGEIFAEGRILQAKVQQVQSQRAFFMLDSGLTGIIVKEDFSDEGGDFSLQDKLRGADTLSCKIKDIDRTTYQVHLTCKDSDMKGTTNINIDVDPYYCESENISLSHPENACKDKVITKQNFMHRMIKHPKFKNMNVDQAVEFLSDKDVGDCLFRPSSRGPSHLTLTLKVFEDLYVHKDITEGGKMKSFTGLLQLGTILTIGHDTFKDLNEVMDQYVSRMVKHLKEILSSPAFRKGSKAEVDELLKSDKPDDPMETVYVLGLSYEDPGTFLLASIKNENLQHESVGLLPSGFMFRKHIFENIQDLLESFQKNINVQPNSTPALDTSPGQSQLNLSKGESLSRDTNDDSFNTKEMEWVSSSPRNVGWTSDKEKEVVDAAHTKKIEWVSSGPNNGGWTSDKGKEVVDAANSWNTSINEPVSVGGGDVNRWRGRGGIKTGNSILGSYPGRGQGSGFGDDNKKNENSWGGNGGGWNASGGNQGGQESSWGQKQESFHNGDDEKKETWGSRNDNAAGGWGGNDDTKDGNEGGWRGGGRDNRGRGPNYSDGRGQRHDFDNKNFSGGIEGGWGNGTGGWGNNNENDSGSWRGGNSSRGSGPRGGDGDRGRGRGRGPRNGSFNNGDDSEGGNFGGGWNSNRNENEFGGNGGNWQANRNNQYDYNSPSRGRGRGGGRGRGKHKNGDESGGGNFGGGWNSNRNENEIGGNGGNWQANRNSQDDYSSPSRGRGRGRGNQYNGDDDSNNGSFSERGGNWCGGSRSRGPRGGRGNWGGNGNSGSEDWSSGNGGNGGFGGGGNRGRGGRGNANSGGDNWRSGGGDYDEADGGGRRGRGGRGSWGGSGNSGNDDWSSGRSGGRRGRGGRGNWGGNGNSGGDGAEGGGRRGCGGGRGNWGSSNENSGGNMWSSGGGSWGSGW